MTEMNRRVCVRAATADDLPAIYEINRMGWDGVCIAEAVEQRHGVVGGTGWRERKAGEVDEACKQHLDRVIVAEAEGVLVGYATSFFNESDRVGEVANNAVHPNWRNRGVATALIGEVIHGLVREGATMLRVTTLERDLPAQRVYEKLGFREIARSVMYTMSAEEASAALDRRGDDCREA